MHVRHQSGYLRRVKRKNGATCWAFLWRENRPSGKRLRRTEVIGTLEQYPTEELARAAVNGLPMCINEDCNRQREQSGQIKLDLMPLDEKILGFSNRWYRAPDALC